jgi:YD repeat-containing protein
VRKSDISHYLFVLSLSVLMLALAVPARATFCGNATPFTFEIFDIEAGRHNYSGCSNGFICRPAIDDPPIYELVNPFCDPSAGPCAVRYRVEFEFPGNRENWFDASGTSTLSPTIYYWDAPEAPSSCNPSLNINCGQKMICATSGGPRFSQERGSTTIQIGGVTCSNVGQIDDVISLSVFTCKSSQFCIKRTDVNGLIFGGSGAALSIGCPTRPIPKNCRKGGGNSCQVCLPGGTDVEGSVPTFEDGSGAGPMSPAGLGYAGGGTGGPGQPGSALWFLRHQAEQLPDALLMGDPRTVPTMLGSVPSGLGRYWSHAYSQQIVPDPDAGHVWLLTPAGTFHEFTDTNADGLYDQAWPSSDKRTLTYSAATGWVLEDLDGTVIEFDTGGLWTKTTDRNGNETTATYSAGQLVRVDMPDARALTFAYDGSGFVSSITEVGVDGTSTHVWGYTWSGAGDLLRVDRPDGTAVELVYGDASWPGYLTRVEEVGTSSGRRVVRAFEYDGSRRVARTWRGDVSSTGPDAVDLNVFDYPDSTTTAVTDPLGVTSTWSYDTEPPTGDGAGALRVTQVSGDCPLCGSGPNSQWEYQDPSNPQLPTKVIDGKGHETVFEYDAQGMTTRRLEAAHDPSLTRETTWEYAGPFPDLVTRIRQPSVDGMGFRDTVMTYDGSTGDLLSRTISGTEAGQAFNLTTAFTYSSEGYQTVVDPPGYGTADQTSFAYDPSRGGQVQTSRTDPLIGSTLYGYDAFNRRTDVTDPNGVTTVTEYDALGRVVKITQQGATAAGDLVTEHVYDEHGDLLRTILPRGNVVEYGYDAAGRLVTVERKPDAVTPGERTRYTLDAAGHRIREDLERGDGAGWLSESATEYTYSTRCHLDRVTRAPGTPEQSITDYSYDCNGNLLSMWDGNHSSSASPPTSSYTYDGLDRLLTVTQPWTGTGGGTAVTTYGYDVQDHLVAVTDAEGNTTTYEYSDRDLLTEEDSPVSGVSTWSYNDHGELVSTTDARGVTVTRTVDALDRVTFVDYPALGEQSAAELDVTYTYDDPGVPFSIGRLTAITRRGESVDFSYDRFGRVLQDGDLTYGYDPNGNRSSIGYAPDVTASYAFDYADRPVSLNVQVGANASQAVASGATYLPSGPLSSLALGNGLTETRTYDGRYSPESIQVPGRLSWSYSADAVGNILGITDTLDASQNRTYGYQDVPYYLTQGDGPWGTRGWSYDRIGNRLSETRDGNTDTYSYVSNGTGNTAILDQVALSVGGTRDYAFGPAGHLEQVTAGANQVVFDSDAEGRLTSLSRPAADALARFEYDGRSFLTDAVEVEAEIFMDGFESGNLACWSAVTGGTKTGTCTSPPPPSAGETVASVYSSEGLLHSLAGSLSAEHVLYFAGRPVAVLEVAGGSGTLTYLSTDHLGTPVLATNGAEVEVWSGGFEPFGEDWNGAEAAGVFLRLPGQWESPVWAEAEMGAEVYYNLHRWHVSSLGMYSRPDPFPRKYSLSEGYFRYVMNNPIRLTDMYGLFEIDPSCSDCPNPLSMRDPRPMSLPILREVGAFCSSKVEQIPDINLRRCINESCRSGLVICSRGEYEDDICDEVDVLGYTARAAGIVSHFLRRNRITKPIRTAFLCADKVAHFQGFAGDTVIHEWAHGCGYDPDRSAIPGIPDIVSH